MTYMTQILNTLLTTKKYLSVRKTVWSRAAETWEQVSPFNASTNFGTWLTATCKTSINLVFKTSERLLFTDYIIAVSIRPGVKGPNASHHGTFSLLTVLFWIMVLSCRSLSNKRSTVFTQSYNTGPWSPTS